MLSEPHTGAPNGLLMAQEVAEDAGVREIELNDEDEVADARFEAENGNVEEAERPGDCSLLWRQVGRFGALIYHHTC